MSFCLPSFHTHQSNFAKRLQKTSMRYTLLATMIFAVFATAAPPDRQTICCLIRGIDRERWSVYGEKGGRHFAGLLDSIDLTVPTHCSRSELRNGNTCGNDPGCNDCGSTNNALV